MCQSSKQTGKRRRKINNLPSLLHCHSMFVCTTDVLVNNEKNYPYKAVDELH